MKWFHNLTARVPIGFAIVLLVLIALQLSLPLSAAEEANSHLRTPVVSDWSHHHVLFPDSQDYWATARFQRDARWMNIWYLRHPRTRWPIFQRGPINTSKASHRDSERLVGHGDIRTSHRLSFRDFDAVGIRLAQH